MAKVLEIKPNDEIIKTVRFTNYGYKDKRHARQFLPQSEEPQTREIQTAWGDTLIAKRGDYFVSAEDNPNDRWIVERKIFEQSYKETQPGTGLFKKLATVALIPLTEFTQGDPDQMITVHSLEGELTVKAGDFYLARGIKGEIWPFPVEKVRQSLYVINSLSEKSFLGGE